MLTCTIVHTFTEYAYCCTCVFSTLSRGLSIWPFGAIPLLFAGQDSFERSTALPQTPKQGAHLDLRSGIGIIVELLRQLRCFSEVLQGRPVPHICAAGRQGRAGTQAIERQQVVVVGEV